MSTRPGVSAAEYCPWEHLNSLEGVTLTWHNRTENPLMGETTFDTKTISLRRGLSDREARSALAHELVHIERGPVAVALTAVEEAIVELTAAMRLIPPWIFVELPGLVERHGIEAMCADLGVDKGIIRSAIESVDRYKPYGAELPLTIGAAEAAALVGVSVDQVWRAVAAGLIDGAKAGGRWSLVKESVVEWGGGPGRARWWRGNWYPVEPLFALIVARGGPTACGVRPGSAAEIALRRARKDPRGLTERMADRLAVELLGLTTEEVWG